jgi:hypothetical protein
MVDAWCMCGGFGFFFFIISSFIVAAVIFHRRCCAAALPRFGTLFKRARGKTEMARYSNG